MLIPLDAALGIVAVVALRWRRSHPFGVALGVSLLMAVSDAASGAWLVAVVSLATRRQWLRSLTVLLVSVAANTVAMLVLGFVDSDVPWWTVALFVALVHSLLIAVGSYFGARRDLLASLRDRAETAEREQALRVGQARTAERATIAREMHDVLAHRISLVAMHAGALAYRADLSEAERTAEAHLIQENAHRALSDLRDVLGVLRAPGLDDAGEAGDGIEADRVVAQVRPDIVLMDIRMPRRDGIAATRALLARPHPPRIVVLTTFDADDLVIEALRSGASGFLLKDTPPPRMVEAIRAVAHGERALSPTVVAQVIAAATRDGGQDRRREALASLDVLTDREHEVAVAVGRGGSNADIADQLHLSVATVKAHVSRIFDKLAVDNRVQIAMRVHDAGLL